MTPLEMAIVLGLISLGYCGGRWHTIYLMKIGVLIWRRDHDNTIREMFSQAEEPAQ